MRKAIFAILITAVGLTLLLSFKPHEITAVADRPAALSRTADSQLANGSGADPTPRDPGPGSGYEHHDDDRDGDHDHDDDHEEDDNYPGFRRGGYSSGGSATMPNAAPNALTSADTWTGNGASAGAVTGEKRVTGDVANTRWGPMQVEIVVSGGKLTGVAVLKAPNRNRRDIVINNRALPLLNQAALAAQSAQIDTVSGATYTSDGYIRSLQSALDKAGL